MPGLTMRTILSALSVVAILAVAPASRVQASGDMFMVRATAKSADDVLASIKSFAEQKKWQFLGTTKIKQGEITLVKVCLPEVAQLLWPLGLQVSAMLPCGNIGVYQKGAGVEVSVLHPRYMYVLHPNPATERAGVIAGPLFDEMLDVITK